MTSKWDSCCGKKNPTAKRILFAHLKRLVKVGNGNGPVIPKLSLTVGNPGSDQVHIKKQLLQYNLNGFCHQVCHGQGCRNIGDGHPTFSRESL